MVSVPKHLDMLVMRLTRLQLQWQGHILSLAVSEDILAAGGKIRQQFESPASSPDGEISPLVVF